MIFFFFYRIVLRIKWDNVRELGRYLIKESLGSKWGPFGRGRWALKRYLEYKRIRRVEKINNIDFCYGPVVRRSWFDKPVGQQEGIRLAAQVLRGCMKNGTKEQKKSCDEI